MNTVKIIFIVVITILIMPIKLKLYLSYDFISNIGKIYFKLFNFEIFFVRFFLKNKNINLVNKKLKVISIPITDNEEIKNYTDMNMIIFKKIDIKRVETNFKFGAKASPFMTAMVLGTYSFFVTKIFKLLRFITQRAKVIVKNESFFQNNMFILNFKCLANISIIDYFWGILESKILNFIIGEKFRWQKI